MLQIKENLPIIRYGKPSAPFLELRRNFFDPLEQDALIEESARLYDLYRSQPPRTVCKNCGAPMGPVTFIKQDISYHTCPQCTHLNGYYDDTERFYRALFSDAGGEVVASHYSAPDRAAFDQRVEAVYRPKLDFICDVLEADGVDPATLSFADIGTGLGHFVKAMLDRGITGAKGYEPARLLVDQGNALLGSDHLEELRIPDLDALIPKLDANVVTLIFVLEHLLDPRSTLEALARNPNMQYVLIAVPVHSPSCYFEMMFPSVYERHLSGHTHLYTDCSLRWLCDQVGLDVLGAWWFGADAMDLFRSVRTRMHQLGQPEAALHDWEKMIAPLIDGIQETMDCHMVTSEVHFLTKVRR
jgi:hypothetical protein